MSVVVSSPLLQLPTRFESTQAPDPRRAALEAKDDLQRDWDAKVLSYEELKPKTQQPSPVGFDSSLAFDVLRSNIPHLGCIFD